MIQRPLGADAHQDTGRTRRGSAFPFQSGGSCRICPSSLTERTSPSHRPHDTKRLRRL